MMVKPGGSYSVGETIAQLAQKIRAAAKARFLKPSSELPPLDEEQVSETSLKYVGDEIIAIGASTGGTEALKVVLKQMPLNSPGIVIVQHMPPGFTEAFARRLNEICKIEVREARDKDPVLPGTVLIAPGASHGCYEEWNPVLRET